MGKVHEYIIIVHWTSKVNYKNKAIRVIAKTGINPAVLSKTTTMAWNHGSKNNSMVEVDRGHEKTMAQGIKAIIHEKAT